MKDTSIVGYIAVQDLTRMGDIIRARTMEALFPLVAVAAIYFVLCFLFAKDYPNVTATTRWCHIQVMDRVPDGQHGMNEYDSLKKYPARLERLPL